MQTEGASWAGAGAGLAALFLGIGLARFGYAPLIPAIVRAGWFGPAAADYLSAINLAGYVAGAWMAGRWLARRRPGPWVRAAMLAAGGNFLLCAWRWPFVWFLLWRLAAGIAAGWLMVLAVPFILERTPAERRGVVGGVIFAGIGSGMVLAGGVVPPLARSNLTAAWLGLGGIGLAVTAAAWPYWGGEGRSAAPDPPARAEAGRSRGLRRLLVAYCASAIGFAAPALFWVDYIARELGRGLAAGGRAYVLLGLAALGGPSLLGWIGDRFGRRGTLAAAMLAEAAAVALPLASTAPAALALAGAAAGGCGIGVTSLTSARTVALTPSGQATHVWGWMTVGFSLAFAAAGAGFAAIYAWQGSYRPVFALAALTLAVGSGFAARAR